MPLALSGVQVLVVDDDSDSRNACALILMGRGASVTVAASAREALARLDEAAHDVLVSDLAMPGGTGYDLIREVRAREAKRGGHIPAVALTGFNTAEDRARVLAEGFQRHLVKPVEAARLVAVVSDLAK